MPALLAGRSQSTRLVIVGIPAHEPGLPLAVPEPSLEGDGGTHYRQECQEAHRSGEPHRGGPSRGHLREDWNQSKKDPCCKHLP